MFYIYIIVWYFTHGGTLLSLLLAVFLFICFMFILLFCMLGIRFSFSLKGEIL